MWKERVGGLPAVWVLAALYLAAAVTVLVLSRSEASVAVVVLFALLLTYCWARPHGGSDIFWIAAAPNAFAFILSDVIGLPAWVALAFIPLSLFLAYQEDREPDAVTDSPHTA